MRVMQQVLSTLAASQNGSARTANSLDPWQSDDWDFLWLGHYGDSYYDENTRTCIDRNNPR